MERNPVGVPQLTSAGMRSYVVGKPLWGLFPYCGTPPVGAVAPTGGYISGTPNGVLMVARVKEAAVREHGFVVVTVSADDL